MGTWKCHVQGEGSEENSGRAKRKREEEAMDSDSEAACSQSVTTVMLNSMVKDTGDSIESTGYSNGVLGSTF